MCFRHYPPRAPTYPIATASSPTCCSHAWVGMAKRSCLSTSTPRLPLHTKRCALCGLQPRLMRARRGHVGVPGDTRPRWRPQRSSGGTVSRHAARPFSTVQQKTLGGRLWPMPSASCHPVRCPLLRGESYTRRAPAYSGMEISIYRRVGLTFTRSIVHTILVVHTNTVTFT